MERIRSLFAQLSKEFGKLTPGDGTPASFRAQGTFSKVDEDQRVVGGWAYVFEDDGQMEVDHSGDFIDKASLPALEKAVREYMLESREADEMHVKVSDVGKVVGSLVLTPEKAAAFGIVTKRYGWIVEFQIQDDETWAKIKDGTYSAFSIRGAGQREKVAA